MEHKIYGIVSLSNWYDGMELKIKKKLGEYALDLLEMSHLF